MVIGGYAVNFYGYNRSTGDLDVWINKGKGNKESIVTRPGNLFLFLYMDCRNYWQLIYVILILLLFHTPGSDFNDTPLHHSNPIMKTGPGQIRVL